MPQVQVNGKTKEIKNNQTVLKLLKDLAIKKDSVILELNLKVLKKDELENCVLKEGDQLEIIQMIGGG